MMKDTNKELFGGESSTGSNAVTKEEFLDFLNSPSFEEVAKQEKDKDNDIIDIKEKKSLEEIIQDIADEEGMTYEETMKLYEKGMHEINGMKARSAKKKAKAKAKRKQAKQSRKKNR